MWLCPQAWNKIEKKENKMESKRRPHERE